MKLKMLKKVIAVVCATSMMAAMLAGCGNNADTPSSEEKKPSSEAKPSEESTSEAEKEPVEEEYVPTYPIVDEPITITMAICGQDMSNPTRTLWERVEEVTNIHVEFVNVEWEQLNVYLAGNEWPDVFMHGIYTTQQYEYGVLGGKFVDYNEYKDIMPNLWAMFEEYPNALGDATQIDGRIYTLPRIEETCTVTMSRQHFRSDILEAAGVERPETPEEFYDVLVACRDYLDGQAPMVSCNFDIVFPAFGEHVAIGYYDDGTGKVGDNRIEQQYRDFLSYMNKLYEEGLLHQEYLTLDGTTKNALFEEGKTAFTDSAGTIQKTHFADGQWHLESLQPLVENKGDTPVCITPAYVKGAECFAINVESPYVEEICKMVDIAFAKEEVVEGSGLYGLAFNYGPVGTNMTLIDDETYTIHQADGSEQGSVNLGQVAIFGYAGYNDNKRVAAGDTNLAVRSKGWRDYVLPYATGQRMPEIGWNVKLTDDEMAVYEELQVGFNSYFNEMLNKFIMGVEDVDDDAVWENYCQQMKDYGLEEILEIYQVGYTRYIGK